MAEETQFGIVDLDRLIWPISLALPAKRFRLFVAADTTQVPTAEISDFAQAALSRGMVYLCAWGQGCERFHDIVDDVIGEDDVGARRFAGPNLDDVVMTTWHDDEGLEDALTFFATTAFPTDGFLEDSSYRLVVCVGNSEWASAASRFLGAARYFV